MSSGSTSRPPRPGSPCPRSWCSPSSASPAWPPSTRRSRPCTRATTPSRRSRRLERGQYGGPPFRVRAVRRVEAHPVDHVAVAAEDQCRKLLGLADHRERVHQVVVDQPAHLHPLALL